MTAVVDSPVSQHRKIKQLKAEILSRWILELPFNTISKKGYE